MALLSLEKWRVYFGGQFFEVNFLKAFISPSLFAKTFLGVWYAQIVFFYIFLFQPNFSEEDIALYPPSHLNKQLNIA